MPVKHIEQSRLPAAAGNGEAGFDALRRTARDAHWAALLAALLGVTILLGVGFGAGVLHSAAHDTRHSIGFPCH